MKACFAFLANYVRNSTTIWPLEMLSLLAVKIFNIHLSLHLELRVTLPDLRQGVNMTVQGNAIICTCSKGKISAWNNAGQMTCKQTQNCILLQTLKIVTIIVSDKNFILHMKLFYF